jgi:hypothetical protein
MLIDCYGKKIGKLQDSEAADGSMPRAMATKSPTEMSRA